MRRLEPVERWGARLRLVWAVGGAALFMTGWILHQAGSWPERVWGAALAAFAPVVIAWPLVARAARRPRLPRFRRLGPGSLGELDALRRAGAI